MHTVTMDTTKELGQTHAGRKNLGNGKHATDLSCSTLFIRMTTIGHIAKDFLLLGGVNHIAAMTTALIGLRYGSVLNIAPRIDSWVGLGTATRTHANQGIAKIVGMAVFAGATQEINSPIQLVVTVIATKKAQDATSTLENAGKVVIKNIPQSWDFASPQRRYP
eukprot:scaffold7904_cov66-Cyclotella_meneghiniana.AAC.2